MDHAPATAVAFEPSLTPEQRFLCALLAAPAAAAPCPAEELRRTLDWRLFLAVTPANLYPYVGYRLAQSDATAREQVPSFVVQSLERAARASVTLHLRRQHELRILLEALERQAIPVIVLKGMALAHLVYPQPALRPMADLDLLVGADRWPEAQEALIAQGLRVPARWAVRPRTGAASKPDRDKPLQRPGTSILVELHDRLLGEEMHDVFDMDSVWARSRPAVLGGVPARVLHEEDFLTHLCLHLSREHFFQHGLRPLVDVALYVEASRGRWRWDLLASRWRASPAAPWMHLTLRLARELLSADIPEEALQMVPAAAAGTEARALALSQVWNGPRMGVPPGLVTLMAAPASTAAMAYFFRRLNPWRAEERQVQGGRAVALRAAVRRLAVDLGTRVPRYVAACRRGDLAPARLREARQLERERARLQELMDARGPQPPSGAAFSRPETGPIDEHE